MADVSEDKLVMRLEFEDSSGTVAADTSPNGTNPAQLRNGVQFRPEGGEYGGVVELDGDDDYIDIPGSQELNLSTQSQRTVSLWFNPSTLEDGKQVLYEEGGAARGLNIYLDGGKLYVGGWNRPENNWKGTYLETEAVEADSWHQVSLVLDAAEGEAVQEGGLRAYLDGQPFGQGSASSLWQRAGASLGAVDAQSRFHDGAMGNSSAALNGRLDDVRVYNRALSAEEIAQLAGAGEAAPQKKPIGVNLNGLSYFSPQIPLQNVLKSSRLWRTWLIDDESGVRVPEYEDQLALDENGWVKSLPAPDVSVVATMLAGEVADFASGEYVVLYDGEGTIDYGGREIITSEPGRDVINFSGEGLLFVEISATDPNQTGDYIRNVRIVPKEYENSSGIFNPEFIEKVDPFPVFRFMDWMQTNNSKQEQWSDRPTSELASFYGIGVPVEYMVELANLTDTNPWFSLPHKATDEYVSNFAQYVKDNLDPELDVYVEYSNEVWNGNFAQSSYVRRNGIQEFAELNIPDNAKKLNWYGKRTSEVIELWEEAFDAESERVIGVLGAKSASILTARQPLYWLSGSDPRDENPTYDPAAIAEAGIDAVAIAPYFGRAVGLAENEAEVESWTTDADGGLEKLFTEINEGGVLSNGPVGGLLEQVYREMQDYAELTEQLDLDLLAYEGGQSLRGIQGVENNEAISDLFIEANRDPRMGEVYREYFTEWFELGGGPFVHFSDITIYGPYGSWGALENVGQDSSPKYDALLDLVGATPAATG